ncbi:MAG: pantetheine-phosphate adenylyltransferase [Clostridia bacterium]|nr:pantetheine-phosphate adenylyltransferase [Clostridia bacterium]
MKHKMALVTGSFDPITNGHVDIARRAAALFDQVIVLVAQNAEKQYMFSADERAEIAKAALADILNVTVETCDGYVADFAKVRGADAFVRGIRGGADVTYEQTMADTNFSLCGLDTVLLFAKPEYHTVSSTAVRRCLAAGTGAEEMMPPAALQLARSFLERRQG